MKGSRAKGNRARRKSIELLEGCGYKVAIVERTGKFIKIKDMFGLFDLVAILHPEKYRDEVQFVQVTCNKPHSHKAYKQFSKDYPHIDVVQHVWMDGGKLKYFDYENGEVRQGEASRNLTEAVRKAK
jgi:hypothetical protein